MSKVTHLHATVLSCMVGCLPGSRTLQATFTQFIVHSLVHTQNLFTFTNAKFSVTFSYKQEKQVNGKRNLGANTLGSFSSSVCYKLSRPTLHMLMPKWTFCSTGRSVNNTRSMRLEECTCHTSIGSTCLFTSIMLN